MSISDYAQKKMILAIDMQKKIDYLKDEQSSFGLGLSTCIGIDSAYMTADNIGSRFLKDYTVTVIDRQITIASRLESMVKQGKVLVTYYP